MTKHIKGVLGTKLGMTQVFDDDGQDRSRSPWSRLARAS